MKDTVLKVTELLRDEEYTRLVLKGESPYYKDSIITLAMEYQEEVLNIPEIGEEFILKLKGIHEDK